MIKLEPNLLIANNKCPQRRLIHNRRTIANGRTHKDRISIITKNKFNLDGLPEGT
jgi:hypothetical protein